MAAKPQYKHGPSGAKGYQPEGCQASEQRPPEPARRTTRLIWRVHHCIVSFHGSVLF
jgi:hypothetical protein